MPPTDQASTQAAIAAALTSRPITATALIAALSAIVTYVGFVQYETVGGSLSGNMPNPTIAAGAVTNAMLAPGVGGGNVIVVPIRTAAGSTSVTTTANDFIVCLNGPTSVQLEATPPIGTTHILKDCRPSGGSPISVSPSGSDTIDSGSSISLALSHQAMTVSYSNLGWEVY